MLTLKYVSVLSIKGLYTYCQNTYPKGTALIKMYRVVPQTKIGNRMGLPTGTILYEQKLQITKYLSLEYKASQYMFCTLQFWGYMGGKKKEI